MTDNKIPSQAKCINKSGFDCPVIRCVLRSKESEARLAIHFGLMANHMKNNKDLENENRALCDVMLKSRIYALGRED